MLRSVEMGGSDVANFRLNRLQFWILVAVYFAIKIPLAQYAMANLGSSNNWASSLDTPLVITLAFVTGARLQDAGLNRWIGIVAVMLITLILTFALLIGWGALSKP